MRRPDGTAFFKAPWSVTIHAGQRACVEINGVRFETCPFVPVGTWVVYGSGGA